MSQQGVPQRNQRTPQFGEAEILDTTGEGKGIVRHCVLCKKIEGLPHKSVFCPDLPDFRVDDAPPFTHAGIDFVGTLTVSDEENAKYYVSFHKGGAFRAYGNI